MVDTVIGVKTILEVEQELNRLEAMLEAQDQGILEVIGEQLAVWEQVVRQGSHYALALRIGQLLEEIRQYWLALSWYQWIGEAQPSEQVTEETIIRSIRLQGRMYIRLGMYKEALVRLEQAEALIQRLDDSPGEDLALIWQNMASLYFQLRSYEQALQKADAALELFKQIGDRHRMSILKLMTGTYHYALQRYDAAFELLCEAREGLEEFRDYFHLARCWHNYAELLRDSGRLEEAIAAWRMSLEMKKLSQDHVGQVNTLLSISEFVSSSQGDWHSALFYATQAIALCHEHHLYDQEIVCLDRWSTILFELGRYSELEICAARALHLSESVTTQEQVASLLRKIASDYLKIGYEDLARQYNMNAVQILS
jgi:tetratricopeptide (TPR) repeat protein